mmetsp:Transcript_131266/g.379738  ORF Transcript_131266/g.379738 Transcript_131266/m.379738 type:complete len:204 (+) Transcript_131266:61-672(+)
MLSKLLLGLAALMGAENALAFAPGLNAEITPRTQVSASRSDDSIPDGCSSRRAALSKFAGIIAAPAVLGASLPAFADVSDGNALPGGAAQFGRVIRAKADMITVSKRVSEAASEMDKKEWDNVGGFLRKVYGVGEDMKAIANGFDAEKKKKAGALIDDLKKYAKAADAPTGSQNGPEFVAYAKKITGILDEFLDLMSDVPDEL